MAKSLVSCFLTHGVVSITVLFKQICTKCGMISAVDTREYAPT